MPHSPCRCNRADDPGNPEGGGPLRRGIPQTSRTKTLMNLRIISVLASLVAPAVLVPVNAAERRASEPVRQAVVRSLSLIQKSMAEYPRNRTCFSCHHQGVPMFALS